MVYYSWKTYLLHLIILSLPIILGIISFDTLNEQNKYLMMITTLIIILYILSLARKAKCIFLNKAALEIENEFIFIEDLSLKIQWRDLASVELKGYRNKYVQLNLNRQIPIKNHRLFTRMKLMYYRIFYKQGLPIYLEYLSGNNDDIYLSIKQQFEKMVSS